MGLFAVMNTTFLVSKQLWRYNDELWSKFETQGLYGIYKPSGTVVAPSLCLCTTT